MQIECYIVVINNKAISKITTQLSTANAWRNSYNRWPLGSDLAVTKKFLINLEQGEVMYDKNYPNS